MKQSRRRKPRHPAATAPDNRRAQKRRFARFTRWSIPAIFFLLAAAGLAAIALVEFLIPITDWHRPDYRSGRRDYGTYNLYLTLRAILDLLKLCGLSDRAICILLGSIIVVTFGTAAVLFKMLNRPDAARRPDQKHLPAPPPPPPTPAGNSKN